MINNHYFKKNIILALFLLIYLYLTISISYAAFITIDSKVDTHFENDQLTIRVELTNRGDEPAHNLVVNTEVGNYSKTSKPSDILEVNKVFQTEFDFHISFDKPGNYPVVVRMDFADVKGYPFSFLSLTHFSYKEEVLPNVFAVMEPLQIAKKGKLHLRMKNLDAEEREVRVRLIVPREISAASPIKVIKLEPMDEQEISFPVSNFSALVGADYAIYTLMEYEDKERHYSSSATSSIKIIEKHKLTRKQTYLLLGLPLGLLILFALFVICWKRKKDKGSPKND